MKCQWNTGKPVLKECLETVTKTWLEHVPKDKDKEAKKAEATSSEPTGSHSAQASMEPAKVTAEVTPKGAPSPPPQTAPCTTSKAKPEEPPKQVAEAKASEVKKEFLRPTPKVKAQDTFPAPAKAGAKAKTGAADAVSAAPSSMDTTSGTSAAVDVKDNEMEKKKDDPAKRTSSDDKDDSTVKAPAASDPKKGTRALDPGDKPPRPAALHGAAGE